MTRVFCGFGQRVLGIKLILTGDLNVVGKSWFV